MLHDHELLAYVHRLELESPSSILFMCRDGICFDEECLGFLDQRKRAKMQWIQDPSQSNVDILNNVRREVSRHFRYKKKAYLRAKIEELETNSKIQNIRDLYRGINDFKKVYQPRCYIVKDEKGDLVAD